MLGGERGRGTGAERLLGAADLQLVVAGGERQRGGVEDGAGERADAVVVVGAARVLVHQAELGPAGVVVGAGGVGRGALEWLGTQVTGVVAPGERGQQGEEEEDRSAHRSAPRSGSRRQRRPRWGT